MSEEKKNLFDKAIDALTTRDEKEAAEKAKAQAMAAQGVECFSVIREQRQDQAEGQQVNEDNQYYREETFFIQFFER